MGHAQVHAYTADTRPLLPAPMRKVIYAQATCKKLVHSEKIFKMLQKNVIMYMLKKSRNHSELAGFIKSHCPKALSLPKSNKWPTAACILCHRKICLQSYTKNRIFN